MRLGDLPRELRRRDPVLAATGWIHVALFLLFAAAAPFDPRLVTGINPWIKPAKFAFSIALYVFSVAWFLEYLPGRVGLRRVLSRGIATAMSIEIACIALQAARGVTSHFNMATTFDAAVFQIMGGMILVNTGLVLVLLMACLVARPALSPAYLVGIRLGLLVLLLGSLEGMSMILRGAHTVGAPDGGPGLFLLGWSTTGGDLRAAHLLGLHAVQVLPLAGYWLDRRVRRHAVAWLIAFTVVYVGAAGLLFAHAMLGRPVVPRF
jgi:hypothetical protein